MRSEEHTSELQSHRFISCRLLLALPISFASGLIYGLMTTGDAEKAVNYGAAHGALAMTTPGDTTMADRSEVEAIMGGAGARVKR